MNQKRFRRLYREEKLQVRKLAAKLGGAGSTKSASRTGGTAYAHFFAGRYDEACFWADKSFRERQSYLPAVRVAAASHALAGRMDLAQKALAYLMLRHPTLRVSNLRELLPIRRQEDAARLAEGLRKAGLPD